MLQCMSRYIDKFDYSQRYAYTTNSFGLTYYERGSEIQYNSINLTSMSYPYATVSKWTFDLFLVFKRLWARG